MKKLLSLFIFTTTLLVGYTQCTITPSISEIPASCNGVCDGQVVFSFSNSGTDAAPYNAILKDGSGNIVDSYTMFNEFGTHIFTDLCAGNYTVTLQGIFVTSCISISSITVTEPTVMSISSINVVHEVNGANNGSIGITATGGTLPYTYSNNNGTSFQFPSTFNSLTDGIYYVILQDANGCTDEEIVSVGLINTSGCEVTGTITPASGTCASTCDGTVVLEYDNLQVTPGAPYTVTLEDGDGNVVDVQNFITETQTVTFLNLCADIYTATVQGGTCSFIISTVVDAPAPLGIFVNPTNPTFGLINGSAEFFVSGGTPPFNYSVDGGTIFQPSSVFSNLDDGNYTGMILDNNGCAQQTDFTLTDLTICDLTITGNVLPTSGCFNSCTGEVTYNYSDINENGPYQISLIQNGVVTHSSTFTGASGSGTFTGICPGNFTLRIENYLGCIAEDNGTILNPTALNITSVSTTTTGVGTSTGTATLSTTGGQAPYTYSINGTTFAGSATFTNLAAGSYTAYVEDANGCSDQMSFYINENACDFGVNFSADSVSCQGMCDGVLNFDFSGSTAETPFYVELFKDGNLVDASVYTIPTISDYYTGMCVGIYTLSVMSSSGCKQFAVTEIEAPLQMNLAAETETATVYANNGSVLLFANGGTPPYQYSIDDQTTWQSNSQFDNLYSDNYMAWVEDVNGCLAATSVFVPDTATCTSVITLQTTNVSCPEDCDGTITVIFNDTGNNPNYVINLYQGSLLVDTSIVYTTFSGLFEFTGLCEGAYQLHVVDEDGCADVQPVYIHSTDSMHVSDIIITESTPGNADGSAELILQGGTAPFLFTIDDGNTWNPENYFGNLNNGSYTTMIKDDHDCIFIYQFTVNDFPGCNINTTFDLTQPISCYDSCDAIITYSFSDALNNPPYTLDLMMNTLVYETQVHTTNSFTGVWDTLCLGFYSIRVTDGNGCQSEMPYVTVTRPADLTLDLLVTDALPGQSNGLVDLLSSGGTGQHTYSLDAVNYQTQTSYEDLMPGNYLAYVMDENFCEDTASFIITENSACDLALSFLTDDLMTCPGDCNGAISFEYTDPGLNNAPYSVKLMDQTGSILATAIGTATNETGIFMNLCAGDYQITVEDLYGCQTAPQTISITQPDYLEVDQVLVEPFDGYYNGSITLNATGGTAPYEFSTNQITWSTTNTWTGLNAGFYILYVRDDNGCEQVICVVLENEWVTSVLDNESDFAAYPNPTQNLIFISHHNIQLVNVYTTSGSRVEIPYTHFDNGTTVDFSNLASGIYLVEFVDADGKIMRGKVVKE